MGRIRACFMGDIGIDIVAFAHRLQGRRVPTLRELVTTLRELVISVGGSAANSAYACSLLGLKTRFIGKIGEDMWTKRILDGMAHANLDLKLKKSEENNSVAITINLRNGGHIFMHKGGANTTFSIEDVNLGDIKGDVLHIGGYNLLDALRKDVPNLFEYAKKERALTSLDLGPNLRAWSKKRVADLRRALHHVDILFLSAEEAMNFTGSKSLGKAIVKLRKLPCFTVVKMGPVGGAKVLGKRVSSIPALPVKVVDTTGAGDCFNVGFIYAYLNDFSLEHCARYGVAAAAACASGKGRERYPTSEELEWIFKRIRA